MDPNRSRQDQAAAATHRKPGPSSYNPTATSYGQSMTHGASKQMTVPDSHAPSSISPVVHTASHGSFTETTPPRLPASPGMLAPHTSTAGTGAGLSTPTRLSVVLLPSPSNLHEYSEPKVNTDPAPISGALTPHIQPGTPRSPAAPASRGRGRPKGWRPGMSYAGMRGNAPPDSATRSARPARPRPPPGSLSIKRRGRPPKAPSPPPAHIFRRLQPAYLEFLCEWSGCKAELQNLETLRRHVLVVHVKRQSGRHCLWGKCGEKTPRGLLHEDQASLVSHLEQTHMIPISWHVGDGPSNRWDWAKPQEGSINDVPDFLKDPQGNQVTPSTRQQEIEDLVTYRLNRQKLKDLIMARDANIPSGEESEASGAEL